MGFYFLLLRMEKKNYLIWWHTLVIPRSERLRQKTQFEPSLGNSRGLASFCSKITKKGMKG